MKGLGPRTRVQPEQALRVYALLEEASVWLRARGSVQWSTVYPRERFEREVADGLVWHWCTDAESVATVTLYPTAPDYYPPGAFRDSLPAWYLCRFAVRRDARFRGVGERLLEELAIDASREGIRALRLDVSVMNDFLHKYYESRGFSRTRVVEIRSEPAVLFERVLG